MTADTRPTTRVATEPDPGRPGHRRLVVVEEGPTPDLDVRYSSPPIPPDRLRALALDILRAVGVSP